jgi:hypothetical protein
VLVPGPIGLVDRLLWLRGPSPQNSLLAPGLYLELSDSDFALSDFYSQVENSGDPRSLFHSKLNSP